MRNTIVDIYNMTSISGFAPCYQDNLCTLATCMVEIRKRAGNLFIENDGNISYWIVGRAGSPFREIKNQLIYFMEVTEVLSFDEYYREKKYRYREDCIYMIKENIKCNNKEYELNWRNYKFVNDAARRNYSCNHGHGPKHDIGKGQYVLLSRNFKYFGKKNKFSERLQMDIWDIDELEWKPHGLKGPFYRKFDFINTDKIINELMAIEKEYTENNILTDDICYL